MSLGCVTVQRLLPLVVAFAVTRGRSSEFECITGPFDTSALAQWSNQYGDTIFLAVQSDRQFIFPGVQFRCSGRVTKWIIAAEFDSGDIDTPVMGIYRDMGVGNEYSRVDYRSVEQPGSDSPSMLYEYTPDTPQPFQNGDILGLYQPDNGVSRLQVLFGEVDGPQMFSQGTNGDFDDRGLANFSTTGDPRTDRLPLVAVEIENDNPDSTDCTRDFISRDLLELLLVRDFSFRQDGHQFLFPSYNFSCDGAITSWSLGEARWDNAANCANFPQLQIWRMNTSSNVHYYRVNSTELTVIEENTNELYSDTVDPPLEFQVGDVLGMFLPREDDTCLGRLQVFFGRGGGQTYMTERLDGPLDTIVLGDTSSDRPFLALEIATSTSSATVTTPLSSTTATNSEDTAPPTPAPSLSPPTELPVTVIAVGASVGGVALAIVAVLIVLAAVLCARKKGPNPKDRSVDAIDMAATTAEEVTYDNPYQQVTTVSTKHNEAYSTCAIATEQNEAYSTSAIATEQNEAYSTSAIATEQNEAYSTSPVVTEQNESYALTTAPNAAYSSSSSRTAVPLQSNEAYGTTCGGSTDEYDYIPA